MTTIQMFIVGVLCVAFLIFVAHTVAGAIFMGIFTAGICTVTGLAEDSCRAFDRVYPPNLPPGAEK